MEEKRDGLAAPASQPPDPDAPDGMTEEDAVVLREVGEPPSFDFEPRDHLEIGTELGLIEIEAAARPQARASPTCWATSSWSSWR